MCQVDFNLRRNYTIEFIRLWFTGYLGPVKFFERLRDKPAPQCGFYGPFICALMDALLIFLPAHLMGETPPMDSYLASFHARTYYTTLIWLALLIYSSNVWREVG
ncbi:MAG: hypothetical protein A2029_13325 [Chloroflexi bacterium RBG_19FT_COMBO_47_9]|nr:MAG: hypothetical protein A2029_13325 [Chloroflexi bacterium RBG_19FT_COMBO_47_9]